MAKTSQSTKARTTQATVLGPTVYISDDSHQEPIGVVWQQGDTVATVLQRAHLSIGRGLTAVLARRRVADPATTDIRPGERILIAGKPGHG